MTNFLSADNLFKYILNLNLNWHNKPVLILIGGCSQSGKTTLTSALINRFKSYGINAKTVKLDSWLISVEKRINNSTVLERYDIPAIIPSIKIVMKGETIHPPVYEVETRRRIAEYGRELIRLKKGILLVEGVIALSLSELFRYAALKIFVAIPDDLRVKRLVTFYTCMKKLNSEESENIIAQRENEEVPFIKKTVNNADVIFNEFA